MPVILTPSAPQSKPWLNIKTISYTKSQQILTYLWLPIEQNGCRITPDAALMATSNVSFKANLKDRFLEHLLPACCLLCGQRSPNSRLCTGCENDLPRIDACCKQCGLPGQLGAAALCAACLRHQPSWSDAIAALVYEYPVDHLVWQFKFHKNLACGQLLAEELVRAVKQRLGQNTDDDHTLGVATMGPGCEKPDLLIPVPLHFFRRCKRGFNQAELIAAELQQQCGIPVQRHLLSRVSHTSAQSGLDRKTRQKNLQGAFRCSPLHGAHVALIDDVLTTGATLQECSRMIKKAGASRVSVWVAARVPAPVH
jgi:ComF family protein